ncbi:unnamed protein product [Thelazia callipaeda]|uniref:Transthyretin-like family protein n=1 Tax=Thelazia callipaeda TaxID=103827 RepID=A0A0N5CL89_THECL|nr:unnamed protein product [Thelazia callipaeda]
MLHILLLTLSILVPYTYGAVGGLVGRTQSAGAKGFLTCNGRPESGVLIKLYDDDRGFDIDDFMGETITDSQGFFQVQGYNAEISPIDPKINIYHDCNDGWWPCQRKVSIMIPDQFISIGNVPQKLYDLGTMELAVSSLNHKFRPAMMFRSIIVLTLCPTVFSAIGGIVGRAQSTGIRGRLLCNGKPASRVLVKLYDDDRGLDMDDFMGETKTNSQGDFELQGYIHEFTPIDPKMNIYHDCNDEWKPCQRKISIMIPNGYITEAKKPTKWYNAGTIELAGKFAGETRDCIH